MRCSYLDATDNLTKRFYFIFSKGYATGVEFLVGFETEFILLKSTHPIEAVNDAPWSASSAVPSGSDAAKCLEEIVDALRTGEIEVLMYHSEAAPGQVRDVSVMIGVWADVNMNCGRAVRSCNRPSAAVGSS